MIAIGNFEDEDEDEDEPFCQFRAAAAPLESFLLHKRLGPAFFPAPKRYLKR